MLKAHNADLCSVCSKKSGGAHACKDSLKKSTISLVDKPSAPKKQSKSKEKLDTKPIVKQLSQDLIDFHSEALPSPTLMNQSELKKEIANSSDTSLHHVLSILEDEFKNCKEYFFSFS